MEPSVSLKDPPVGWAGARRSYRTALGTPSERAKFVADEVKRAKLEAERVQATLDTMTQKNRLLSAENKAVKAVNAQLRDMVETRVPYVATPPAPLPAQPYGAMSGTATSVPPAGFMGWGAPGFAPPPPGFGGPLVLLPGEKPSEEEAAENAKHWAAHYEKLIPGVDQETFEKALAQDEEAMQKVAEKGGPDWLMRMHGHQGMNFNTSYAKYYQDMLSSHAEYAHKKYLEKREVIVANAEMRQQELLRKEAELTQAEEEHEQFLMERKKLLQESENEYRRSTQLEYPSEYYYGFSHRAPRGQPLEYEQALLNKHRLERYKQAYLEDLEILENYHKQFDAEYWGENEKQLVA